MGRFRLLLLRRGVADAMVRRNPVAVPLLPHAEPPQAIACGRVLRVDRERLAEIVDRLPPLAGFLAHLAAVGPGDLVAGSARIASEKSAKARSRLLSLR